MRIGKKKYWATRTAVAQLPAFTVMGADYSRRPTASTKLQTSRRRHFEPAPQLFQSSVETISKSLLLIQFRIHEALL
jgi:hypothetical protein